MKDRMTWLAQRHAAWQTPARAIADAVRTATGASIARAERIIEGEANETYHVATTAGTTVVVKIAHVWPEGFERMHEASDALLAAGIEVPRVVLRTTVESGGRSVPLVVQTFVPGTPMTVAARDASDDSVRTWTRQAGALLARIHAAPVPTAARASRDEIGEALRLLDGLEDVLGSHGLDPGTVRALLVAHASALEGFPACREHGDFGADHIVIRDGEVRGVIDLDNAAVGTPLTDIVWWDTYFDTAPHPTEALLEGYGGRLGDIRAARAIFGLARCLGHLAYFTEVENPGGVAHIAGVMRRRMLDLDARDTRHP